MIIDAYATDTVPSHEVRRRANEALAAAGEPMSEVTYDALRKRLAKLEAALRQIEADCDADYPPSTGAIKYAARAALGEKQ